MRPRKQVLLFSPSPMDLSRWTLILDLRGYRVHATEDAREAYRLALAPDILCAVLIQKTAADGVMELAADLFAMRETHPELRIMVVNYTKELIESPHVDGVVQGMFTNAAAVDLVGQLTTKKRGPKAIRGVPLAEIRAAFAYREERA